MSHKQPIELNESEVRAILTNYLKTLKDISEHEEFITKLRHYQACLEASLNRYVPENFVIEIEGQNYFVRMDIRDGGICSCIPIARLGATTT